MSNSILSRHSMIITTINAPNDTMRAIAAGAVSEKWQFIVVGDKKTPKNFYLEGAEYLSLASQMGTEFELAKLLPVGHYARKNIGYLHAIQSGADVIVETDDDNIMVGECWLYGSVTSEKAN